MKVPKTEPPRKSADPGLPIARNDRLLAGGPGRMFRGRDWLPPVRIDRQLHLVVS